MLTLFGSSSTRAMRALWMLEELGLGFDHVPCPPRAPELSGRTVLGKVPVLEADGADITDSTAILTYLADREGRFTAPAGSVARARQDALTFQILDEFDALLWTAARHTFILPEEHRIPAIKEPLRWEFQRNVDRLMQRLDGAYLMGDDLTVPDIIAVHCGSWAKVAKFPVENAQFTEYCERARARDGYRRAAARN